MIIPALLLSDNGYTSKPFEENFQLISMLHVLGVYDAPDVLVALQRKLSQSYAAIDEPCNWRGVECSGDIITKIYFQMDPEVEAYEWIPPTVWDLNLSDQRFRRPIDTRFLPRGLSACFLYRCEIQGTFNVQALPRRLQTIDCSMNAITGTIVLANLPYRLISMDFAANAISHVFVDNDSLPETLVSCSFFSMKSVKIHAIGGNAVDRRILRDPTFAEEVATVWKYVKE